MSWTPQSPGEWTIPSGKKFNFEGPEGPDLLKFEVGSALERSLWAQASAHIEGDGAEFGVDITVAWAHLKSL
eukprot:1149949-Pyramimonas_sp.AAC.1